MSSKKSVQRVQPKWESSQRPLYPKCIWVESVGTFNGGHRHFILDHSISTGGQSSDSNQSVTLSPAKIRQSFVQRKSRSYDLMENSMEYLNIIGSYDSFCYEKLSTASDSGSNRDTPKSQKSKNGCLTPKLNSGYKKAFKTIGDTNEITNQSHLSAIDTDHIETLGMNDLKRLNDESNYSNNELAERVLQWLDLANGRNVAAKRADPNGNGGKRRTCTAQEQRRKIQEQMFGSTAQQNSIARESIHRLSLTFNEDDKCVVNQFKNSVNALDATVNDRSGIAMSFGDFFPITYRCSRKFLSLRRSASLSTSNKNLNDCIQSADSQLAMNRKGDCNEKKSTGKQLGENGKHNKTFNKLDSFESQYRAMIQRQILENSCNTFVAKRQLHIFMPNLPKKRIHECINSC